MGMKDNKAIFIYEDNTWSINYVLGENRNVDTSKIPSENEAIVIAEEYLKNFKIFKIRNTMVR